ncbi:MAG: ATP-binding protein [Spartobacteria bacterium]|nr:ATP-binding protein [Spartobacteria bacterium]
MYTRLLNRPIEIGSSFFLFGPRGTGKTTWLRQHFHAGNAVFLDLLNADIYTDLLAQPHRLETYIPVSCPGWIVIDEIQRVPALLSEVHRLISNHRYRFALTGSSARSLRKKGVNLLAGRALTFHMYPLTAVELGKDFDLATALRFGNLPTVIHHNAPREYLKSYISTYLREEIQQEGLTRNLANFTRFLEIASFSQGAMLNISMIAREASLDRKVVDAYFGILHDLLIARNLPVFTKRAKRRLVAHPKFYFFDAGVYRTIRPMGPLDSPEETDGACIETLCLQELYAINDLLGLEYELYFWRTADGTEVDFVLYGPRGVLAFEIKRKANYARSDLTALKSFRKDYPMARCYLLYGGERAREEDNIKIIPFTQALHQLPQILQDKEKSAGMRFTNEREQHS